MKRFVLLIALVIAAIFGGLSLAQAGTTVDSGPGLCTQQDTNLELVPGDNQYGAMSGYVNVNCDAVHNITFFQIVLQVQYKVGNSWLDTGSATVGQIGPYTFTFDPPAPLRFYYGTYHPAAYTGCCTTYRMHSTVSYTRNGNTQSKNVNSPVIDSGYPPS